MDGSLHFALDALLLMALHLLWTLVHKNGLMMVFHNISTPFSVLISCFGRDQDVLLDGQITSLRFLMSYYFHPRSGNPAYHRLFLP